MKKTKPFRPDAIFYDFDGVMTDNNVYVFSDGMEAVRCNRSDGWAIGQFKKAGIHQCIISTETNPVVAARAKKLGLPALQGCNDKEKSLLEYADARKINLKRCFYVGNDDNDLPAFKWVGFKIGPKDSSPAVKRIAHVIVPSKGGEGVIRDVYEICRDLV